MTATPHNGKEEDFQLFLALLDGDRFEGRFRNGVHVADVSDPMRRMVGIQLHVHRYPHYDRTASSGVNSRTRVSPDRRIVWVRVTRATAFSGSGAWPCRFPSSAPGRRPLVPHLPGLHVQMELRRAIAGDCVTGIGIDELLELALRRAPAPDAVAQDAPPAGRVS